MKVLVCGGRNYNNWTFLEKELDKFHKQNTITHLIHGAARGADSLANDWAVKNKIKITSYPAEWNKYGKDAGMMRNYQMLKEEKPEVVIAFPGGPGTKNMKRIAKQAFVKILDIESASL